MIFVVTGLKTGHHKTKKPESGLVAWSRRIRDGKYAAGGRCAGGFYFFE
jgi:hypothetical protein